MPLKTFLRLFKRNKSFNSTEWLARRLKDPYVEKAKIENYRCRSAFKLIEIDDRFKIVKPGQVVVDVGAAPGSWTQVLVKRTNARGEDREKPRGVVISVDRSPMYKLEGAKVLSGMDFTKAATQQAITEFLNGRKLDFVFSDMAPNASGVKALDCESIIKLAFCVLTFAVTNLREGGGCLVKVWEGRHEDVVKQMDRFFDNVNYVKPAASQSDSSEIFLLARNFRGLQPV